MLLIIIPGCFKKYGLLRRRRLVKEKRRAVIQDLKEIGPLTFDFRKLIPGKDAAGGKAVRNLFHFILESSETAAFQAFF